MKNEKIEMSWNIYLSLNNAKQNNFTAFVFALLFLNNF
jgi:hypothetical protein